MKTNDTTPNLTAYALGELDQHHDAEVQTWLTSNHAAQAEVDAVADIAQLLQNCAPVATQKMRPEQLALLLAGPNRVREMVAAASKSGRESKTPRIWQILSAATKVAAVACAVALAFIAGRHTAPMQPELAITPSQPPPTAPVVAPTPVLVKAPEPAAKLMAVAAPAMTEIPAMAKAEAPQEAPAIPQKLIAKMSGPVAGTATPLPRATMQITDALVTNISTQNPNSTFTIRPAATTPAQAAQPGFAAPMAQPNTQPPTGKRPAPAPTLLIHSWRAEVTSCPWDATKRLVRLSMQIPGVQAAAAAAQQYDMQVTFPPNYVRTFRKLGQRTVAPVEADGPGLHTAWYEVTPNGASADSNRTLGNVSLKNVKFTTKAMDTFDSSLLRIIDNGTPWEQAGDGFSYDCAVLSFGMLLSGQNTAPALSYKSVLRLAERARHVSDSTGERAEFIKTVKSAERAAGLVQ